jgi:transposase
MHLTDGSWRSASWFRKVRRLRQHWSTTLKRWKALTRYLEDGHVPVDNNVENQIRPWAIGRANWLLAGPLRAGQRAAAIVSLLRSAQLHGHEPHAYLKDLLTRLPTHRACDIAA